MAHIIQETYIHLSYKLNEIRDITNCIIRFDALKELEKEVEISCLFRKMKLKLLREIDRELILAEEDYFYDRLY